MFLQLCPVIPVCYVYRPETSGHELIVSKADWETPGENMAHNSLVYISGHFSPSLFSLY